MIGAKNLFFDLHMKGQGKLPKGKISGIMLTMLLVSVVMLAINIQSVESDGIIVPDDFATIQMAINNASDGDVIRVRMGVYNENVVVDKYVSIVGENRYNTIINGSGSATVIDVRKDNVKIVNFTIQNGNQFSGVYLAKYTCSGCNISQNIIRNCNRGVALFSRAVNNFIANNEILNCSTGVYLPGAYGNFIIQNSISLCSSEAIYLESCKDVIIQGNNISNSNIGMLLRIATTNITIVANNIFNSLGGIVLYYTDHNNVTNNQISCKDGGIYLLLSNYNIF
ncbi:MAG: pectinesterase family protein [Candidatus Bathyarchaeota archaeon]|nr:pectinesterase family protein [Candidatus Bathyarchaeota archaeon]